MVIGRLFFYSFLLSFGTTAYAIDDEDEAPAPDIGLSAESAPTDNKFKISDLTFTLVEGKPVIDGEITDVFWNQAKSLSLDFELYPTRLAPAVVETKAWVAISATHIYVAYNALDPDPQKIRSAFRERDATKDDDYVSIIIDSTGTLAKKYEFRVNPHGSLSDVVQDTISERYIYDWDTRWEGAARMHDNGYSVEIAIPISSVRAPVLQDDEDHRGIIILKRSYPRRVDRTLATFFSFKRGLGKTTQTDNDSLDRLTFTPHYIYHFDEKRPIGGDFSQVEEHNIHEAGIDVAIDFDSARTLSLTINPNFTEVEADIARQSINNPFNVFQPEKRRFFKATTEYYNSLVPAVYTRNIIRPLWGMSYIRDDVRRSVGAFWINDRETEVIMPDNFGSKKVELLDRSDSGSFRYRHTKNRTTIGVIGTLRQADDYHNYLLGLDGLLDLGIDDKLRFQFLYSDTEYPERFANDLCEEDDCTQAPPPAFCPLGNCPVNAQVLRTNFGQPLQGHGLQLRYKHDGVNALYWAGYEEYSPEFRADLGFVRRVDIRSLNLAYGRKWYVNALAGDEGKSRIRGYLIYTHTRSHADNERLENGIGLWLEFRGSYQSVLRVGRRYRERAVSRINQASLETGSNAPLFDENYWQWYFETSPWKRWSFNLDGRFGETADADNLVLGDLVELKPKIALDLGHFRLIASATLRDFDVKNERLYKERFLSLTALYRKDKKISHRLIFLDDLTNRDTQRWLGDELNREIARTLEYTFTYEIQEQWSVLAGIKAEYDHESDVNNGDITNREVYLKFEKRL
jgi:hypothetical protein